MIKFQFFEKSSSLNCHFKNLGTFVVSIAHYMRAYFNNQALQHGNDFQLPGDVGFLNVSVAGCFRKARAARHVRGGGGLVRSRSGLGSGAGGVSCNCDFAGSYQQNREAVGEFRSSARISTAAYVRKPHF